jgi:lipoyl(octanoyl) transferase
MAEPSRPGKPAGPVLLDGPPPGEPGGVCAEPAAGAAPGALECRWLGSLGYGAGHALMQRVLAQRLEDRVPDQLLLLEHDEIVTLGRRTAPGSWESLSVPTLEVERGGEATWHGPGQLVGYPILALPPQRRDLHRYLRDLEQVLIEALAEVGLPAERRPGFTGVWVGAQKLCSIGVAVRRWVTWHGFSLNVCNDLSRLEGFASCGLAPGSMGRVSDRVPVPGDDALLARCVARHFARWHASWSASGRPA